MPTFRIPLNIDSNYTGTGSSLAIGLTGAQVGDTLVVIHGLDYTNNGNNGNGIPAMTGSGISPTSRTTLTFSNLNDNAAFLAASTAEITSDSLPSFTVYAGDRDSSVMAMWAVLPGAWDFVDAGTTGTSSTSSNTVTTPTLGAASGDTLFMGYLSEYQSNTQWSLPSGTSGAVHLFGVSGEGAFSGCWEDLVSGDISGGSVAGRTATKSGTARPRSAAAIVLRPTVTGPPSSDFTGRFLIASA